MIIFRGDAEFGVEFVKFALRQPKITLSRRRLHYVEQKDEDTTNLLCEIWGIEKKSVLP